MNNPDPNEWPTTPDAVERAQLRDTLRRTTPLMRLQWLEETLTIFAPVILENQKRFPKKYF